MLKTASGNTVGALVYRGTWNASTNTPTLQSGVGTKGDYYVVNVAGNTNLDGVTDWQVGDWAVFNGLVWQKIDNTDQVISVNGQQGVVVLGATDVGATPNTAYFIAGTGMSGGGRLTGNVTLTNAGVTAFNTRTGSVTLTSSDISTALGYTPGTGNVASVTATSPVVSSGGNTPVISMPVANATTNGYLSSTDWTTFNSKQPGGTYVTSVTGTAPVVSSGGTTPAISIPAANATTSGYLTSTDWSTFNSKQPAGAYVTSVSGTTGRVSSTGGTTPVIDLVATAVTAGSYGNASTVGTFTVDAYGRLTSAANTTIAIAVGQVSGAVPNTVNVIAGTGLSGGGALTGNVTLNVTANSTNQKVTVQNNGVAAATEPAINFIPGTNVTIQTADDAANTRANVTINVNLNSVSSSATFATASLPLVPEGYVIVTINGATKKIPYYGV